MLKRVAAGDCDLYKNSDTKLQTLFIGCKIPNTISLYG